MFRGFCLVLSVLVVSGNSRLCADQITLTAGDILIGQVLEQTAASVMLQHAVLGRMVIAKQHISDVTIESSEKVSVAGDQVSVSQDEALAAGPIEEAAAELAVVAGSVVKRSYVPFDSWNSKKFEFGFSGLSGNFQTSNLLLGINARKKNERERWLFKSNYFLGTRTGQMTRNQLNMDLTRHRRISDSPWFTFLRGIYDFDEFKRWDHRVSSFGGIGYEFVSTDLFEVMCEVGGGGTKKFGGTNEFRPEGLISTSVLKWHIKDRQTINGSVTLFPNAHELGEFRVISGLAWKVQIDPVGGISFKVGVENEYESVTDGAAKHNDLKYFSSFVISF